MPTRNTYPASLALAGLLSAIVVPLMIAAPRAAVPLRWPTADHPTWTRSEPALEPTWPDQPHFSSDAAARPVPTGELVLFTSSRHDSLTAANSLTGETRWRFVADGPIRFAPTVWRDRIFVVSDDGRLYCLSLEDGSVMWSLRGGPSDQLILGNERLINMWPARGAPAVSEDGEEATVYFGAGIWPFMGIFLHAVDARTGQVRWTNSGDSCTYIKQPHNTDAFAGIAPQGAFAVAGDHLLVAGGRSVPACYDRHTGKRLHYRLAEAGKVGGGPDVYVVGKRYVNGTGAFDLKTGAPIGMVSETTAAEGMWLYSVRGGVCRAYNVAEIPEIQRDKPSGKTRILPEAWLGESYASIEVPPTLTLLAVPGRVYGGGTGRVYAIDGFAEGKPRIAWQARFRGTAAHLAYRDGSLFVSTREGHLHAFGPGPDQAIPSLEEEPLPTDPEAKSRIADLIKVVGPSQGYAVLAGCDVADVAAFLADTALNLIVMQTDANKRMALRDALRKANIPGKRVAIIPHAPAEVMLPPYLCSLLAVNGPLDEPVRKRLFNAVRPYGGALAVREGGDWKVTRRDGPLPGAGNWTHENVNPANTRVAPDTLVKAPLGVLWFGGPGNQDILPRHGHGPVPQVVDGRCIVEGMDQLRAIDIYTGRLLWTASLPGLGQVYDNTAHQAGANAIGSNYVSTSEGIFVALGNECLRLNPDTGRTMQRYRLPVMPGEKQAPRWSFLNVVNGYVIGASNPTASATAKRKKGEFTGLEYSRRVTVLDRESGRVLWNVTAEHGFRHHGICAGGGRLYLLDRKPTDNRVSRDGKKDAVVGAVGAFDLRTGKQLWRDSKGTFGTFLSYSTKHDVILESGLMSRDTLRDEAKGIRAFEAASGKILWNRPDYFGPAMIHGDRILKGGDAGAGSGTACDLLTGKEYQIPDPLTGDSMPWKWQRTYGCNTPAASEHLMLFRSGAAGFYDLCGDGGTGNLGGFRSSCTLNLIPAGGVLVAPDYTRSCTCNYQNQTSLAFVHWPDAELWTFTTSRPVTAPIRRMGLNLGAPGTRRADDGTLWLEYPPVGGPSPKVKVSSTPTQPETFRLHASTVSGEKPWVVCSGARGLEELRITLDSSDKPRKYTVRLYFLEPQRLGGRREFDVQIQGKPALEKFAVDEPLKSLVREFKGIDIAKELVIGFQGSSLLSGVEVIAEGR